MNTNWETLKNFEKYEIKLEDGNAEIRKAKTKRTNKPILNKTLGYYYISLNGKMYRLHRIIAEHYLPHDEIHNVVDHIDRDTQNNNISNLRWTTPKENAKNKSSVHNVNYEFIDYGDEPEDLIYVPDYGKHRFEDYYYSASNNKFYFDNGVQFRILHINYKKDGLAFVYAFSTEHKLVQICYNKFKRLYDIVN